jgi:hypothetical protein
MPYARPTKDQFEVQGDKVTHTPTGSYWVAYTGTAVPHIHHNGRLGETLENSDEYDVHEVEELAHELLASRL